MLHIPKKHIGRRQHIGDAQRKQEQQQDDNRRQQHRPFGRNPEDRQHDDIRRQRIPEIDQRGIYSGEDKQVHRELHLQQQRLVVHKRRHRGGGGTGKHLPEDVAGQIINRVVFDRAAEQLGKNQRKDRHRQQGIEHAPHNSQIGTGILPFDFPAGQLPDDEGILPVLPSVHRLIHILSSDLRLSCTDAAKADTACTAADAGAASG